MSALDTYLVFTFHFLNAARHVPVIFEGRGRRVGGIVYTVG